MKTIVWLLLVILFILPSVLIAQELPFQDGGVLVLKFFAGPSNTELCPQSIREFYTEEYGDFPDYIIWDNIQDTTRSYMRIDYYAPSAEVNSPWWGDSLKWSQLRPYVSALFTSVETGDTLIRNLPEGDLNKIISSNNNGDYNYKIRFACDLLPIPNDGSVWKLELEPTVDITDSVTINPRKLPAHTALRINPATPVDSLLFIRHTWLINNSNFVLQKKVLRTYPYNQMILKNLFTFYYSEEECDSVSHYGNRYYASIVNNLDEFVIDAPFLHSELGIDSVYVETILEMIDDICVDGYAQPHKYFPRFIY